MWLNQDGLSGKSVITIDVNNSTTNAIKAGSTAVSGGWAQGTNDLVKSVLSDALGTSAPSDLAINGLTTSIGNGGDLGNWSIVECVTSNTDWAGYWIPSQVFGGTETELPAGWDLIHLVGAQPSQTTLSFITIS